MEENTNDKRTPKKLSRREAIKSLVTVPVIGVVAYGVYKKKAYDRFLQNSISGEFLLRLFLNILSIKIKKSS
jgi:hypothetical protein